MTVPLPDPIVIDQIAALIKAGNNTRIAAAAAGVSEPLLEAWTIRGEAELSRQAEGIVDEEETPFANFVTETAKAAATAETQLVIDIRKAAQQYRGWQAAAWLLERGYPSRWARPSREEPTPVQPVPEADKIAEVVAMRQARRGRAAG